jgi:hypothetical protein
MHRMLPFLSFVVTLLFALAAPIGAQQPGSALVTVEHYYKLVPGSTSEWLALYRKNHNPILKQLMKEGLLKSEKLYERRFHAETPAWDYKVVMVWRDWAALEQAQVREPEIIRALYPNNAEHDQQEKRRWELTVAHWDDVLNEVPLE